MFSTNALTALGWSLLAALHFVPALALLRPALIERLYGVAPGSTAFLLLQHRAALFVAVVAACVWAAVRPEVRGVVAAVTAVSMVGFVGLWLGAGAPAALRPIALADLAGLPVLGALAAHAAWGARAG